MRWFYKLPLRLRSLFRKARVEQELTDELRFHLEKLIEENVAKGMTPEEARYAALRELGGVEQIKEECRDMRRVNLIETFFQDLHYGARMLVKNPAFTLTAIVTLGLGIGLNSAIFSLVSGLLLREPPVRNPERIVMVTLANPSKGSSRNPASALEFSIWRDQNHVFEDIAASSYEDLVLTGRGEPERVKTARVTTNYFELFGFSASLGRTFMPGEDMAKQQFDAVISYDLWQRKFGGDPGVLGKGIALDGQAYTVIGVIPPEFKYASGPCDVWIMASFEAQALLVKERGNRNINVFARLKQGVSIREARAQTGAILERLAETESDETGWIADVIGLREALVDENARALILLLMGVVSFVLLIACANVAGIFLARSAARQNEFAIRVALGAGRRRLIRQLMAEAFLVALIGGGSGLLLSVWAVKLLRAKLNLNPDFTWLAVKIDVDSTVLIFTLVVSLLTVLLFGLMPALKSSRPDLQAALKGSGGASAGTGSGRVRSGIIIGQLALVMVLMVATGSLVQLLVKEMRAQLGFDPQQDLTMDLLLSGSKYADPARQAAFFGEAIERIQSVPGVQFAGATQVLPESAAPRLAFEVEGQPASSLERRPVGRNYVVSPAYFGVMRIPLLGGRPFAVADRAGTPQVAIINEALSRRFFPETNPIGRRIRTYASPTSAPDSREIVGIVGDVIDYVGQSEKGPEIYMPFLQKPTNAMKLVIRTRVDPALLASAARASVWALDKNQPIGSVEAMTEIVENKGAGDRLLGGLLGAFTGLALGLAAIGIYGMVAYWVAQRTHEIGVRMALGAQKANVFRLVVGKGAFLAAIGVGLGSLGALPVTRILAAAYSGSWLHSTLIPALASVVVMTPVLLACYIPARRAMKIDPMVALRYE